MKISWGANVDPDKQTPSNGYGYATERIIASLRTLGHEVSYMDPKADFHFHFDQPQHFKRPTTGMYSIIYHPWESTLLMPGWADIMNGVDEVWTPSPVIADWYERFAGVNGPVYVYEHGVDDIWTAKERNPRGRKFRFLHMGGVSGRKGGIEAMKAFRAAFPKSQDVELNMKIISSGWNVGKLNRVNIVNKEMSITELVDFYHNNDVFLYPSYGEGFGLMPLQAMATGMPTITVPRWAPYAQFLNPTISVRSNFVPSPWPQIHPGNMLKPNMDDIVDAMRYTYQYWDYSQHVAQSAVESIKAHYDWNRLTQEAFKNLENRL